jgi:CHAD domain-containing protein
VLSAVGRKQLSILSASLQQLLEGDDPEAIHDLRVATRRLQALLAVLSAFPGADALRKLRRSLRELRSALGDWRNCDVSLADTTSRRERAELPAERAAWERIEADLQSRRADEMRRGRARLRRAIDKNLVGQLARALEVRLQAIRATALRQALEDRIERAWSEWNECFESASREPSVELLHALRVATKRVRYATELARDLARARATPVLAWARRAQESLGDWHDRETLHRAIAEAVARPDLALAEPEATLAVLAILARERRDAPPLDRTLAALAHPDEAFAAMHLWQKARRPSSSATSRDGVARGS